MASMTECLVCCIKFAKRELIFDYFEINYFGKPHATHEFRVLKLIFRFVPVGRIARSLHYFFFCGLVHVAGTFRNWAKIFLSFVVEAGPFPCDGAARMTRWG